MSRKCRFCGEPSEQYECSECHRIYTFLLNLYKYTDKALDHKVAEYKEKLVMVEVTRSNMEMRDKVLYVRNNSAKG